MSSAPAAARYFAAPAAPASESPALPEIDRKAWGTGIAVALGLHLGVVLALVAAVIPAETPVPEPVVLVDLPPPAGPTTPQVATPTLQQPLPQTPQTHVPTPPVDIAPVKAPLPSDAVTLPPPRPARQIQTSAPSAPAPVPVPAPPVMRAGADGPNVDLPGNDPKSQKLEADYKSLVGAYIRRNKFSPPQSRKAGINGDVKIRFVVHRNGAITDVSVAGSSGAALLDGEAAAFLQNLSPVPSFPRDLRKAEIPLTITLKFRVESK